MSSIMNDQVTILKLMFNHFIPSEGNSIACVCVCMCVCERERERERERETCCKKVWDDQASRQHFCLSYPWQTSLLLAHCKHSPTPHWTGPDGNMEKKISTNHLKSLQEWEAISILVIETQTSSFHSTAA